MNTIRKANAWFKLYNYSTKGLTTKEKLMIYFYTQQQESESEFARHQLEIKK